MRTINAMLIVGSVFAIACQQKRVVSATPAVTPNETTAEASAISERAEAPQERTTYDLHDLYTKAVTNDGKVVAPMAPYGVRNLRVVLNERVYRGGANNVYPNQPGDPKRDNENPLKTPALETLCEQNFDTAIYLYDKNFSTAPKDVECKGGRKLQYMSLPPLDRPKNVQKILELVHERITKQDSSKKVYLHCWNGWHASGFISAVSLRQFCGMNSEDAVRYWDANTDGNNKAKNYERVRKAIRDFKPDAKLELSPELKKRLCLPNTEKGL